MLPETGTVLDFKEAVLDLCSDFNMPLPGEVYVLGYKNDVRVLVNKVERGGVYLEEISITVFRHELTQIMLMDWMELRDSGKIRFVGDDPYDTRNGLFVGIQSSSARYVHQTTAAGRSLRHWSAPNDLQDRDREGGGR